MSDLRSHLHMLFSGLFGYLLGKGLTWWLLEGNGPWIMIISILLFIINILAQKRRRPRMGVIDMSIMIGPGLSAPFMRPMKAEDCDDKTKDVPIVFPMCEHCREQTCKKSPAYTEAKTPEESDDEYKDRLR